MSFKLSKAYNKYVAPYGVTLWTYTTRYLRYKEFTESIKHFDTGYHTSRCHYTGSCGANHATLREAICCIKTRVDQELTWNS